MQPAYLAVAPPGYQQQYQYQQGCAGGGQPVYDADCGYLFILFCALADTNYICYCCFMAILLLLSTVLLILLLLTVGTC